MELWKLVVLAAALSMDAFAIAVCKGLSVERIQVKHLVITGLWFGGAQGLMPLLGYLLGSEFSEIVEQFDHWISFALLSIIGIGMIREAGKEVKELEASFSAAAMFPLAIADSIDALAAGVTFAFLKVNIIPAVMLIGTITFAVSAFGVWIGSRFGEKYRSKAEILGGVILVAMGVQILYEHLST